MALALAFGLVGAAAPHGWIICLALMVLSCVFAWGASDYRRLTLLFVIYLPLGGIVSLAAYPHTLLGDVARDGLVIAPLYLVFFLFTRHAAPVPGFVRLPLALLTVLVILGVANPSLSSRLVGLVGVRAWLFFVPLLFVGATLARTRLLTLRMALLALLAGLPPLVVGLVESLALASGHGTLLYRLYGSAAGAAFTTGDTDLQGASVSLGSLTRVPSLFAFPVAYYSLCMAMLVPAYCLWRMGESPRQRLLGRVGCGLAATCALASGTRLAFLTVPVALSVMLYIDGLRASLRLVVTVIAAFVGVMFALHVPLATLPHYLLDLGKMEADSTLGGGFRIARAATWLGLGPGADTNAARSLAGGAAYAQFGGRWQESYLVKAWLELGVAGLVVVIWAYCAVVRAVLRSAQSSRASRTYVAAVSGFVVSMLVVSIKGAILDQAPANAYFWFFAGTAMGAARWGGQVLDAQPDALVHGELR